jgi:hypothetical protein
MNNILDKCVLKLHFVSIYSLGGFILSKKVKIIVSYHIICTIYCTCTMHKHERTIRGLAEKYSISLYATPAVYCTVFS